MGQACSRGKGPSKKAVAERARKVEVLSLIDFLELVFALADTASLQRKIIAREHCCYALAPPACPVAPRFEAPLGDVALTTQSPCTGDTA